ncbi:hypothetical protein ACQJBY_022516 [Aegilops geniculata]
MRGPRPRLFHSSRARAAAASATAYPLPSAPPPTLRRRRPLMRPPPRRTLLCPASSASLEQPFPIPAALSLPKAAAPAQQHCPRTYAGAASHVRRHASSPLPRLEHLSGSAAPIPAGPSHPAAAAPAQQRRPMSYAGRLQVKSGDLCNDDTRVGEALHIKYFLEEQHCIAKFAFKIVNSA